MLFTETNEIVIGQNDSLFFVFAIDKAFFDKFICLATAAGNAYSFFLVHTKDNQPKDQIVKIRTQY